MSDIKLFHLNGDAVSELQGAAETLEKSLQTRIERNLETFLGVRFLASEYTIAEGRMDTLGIDENNCPVIVEYKRGKNDNVINQGLFYLDWLMEHQKDFAWLVMERFGKEQADNIEWSSPRLICIAGDFSRYDQHAIKQMGRNIELVRYRKFGDNLLLLEQITSAQTAASPNLAIANAKTTAKTFSELLAAAPAPLRERFQNLTTRIEAIADDVQTKTLKHYLAFRRLKNFACLEIHARAGGKILVYVKADMNDLKLEEGFTRDVRNIGHFGTGDLEITIKDDADIDKAMPLIEQSYEAS
ncbi:MAG: DUF91 domain-containing protein [Candidatus Thiothrix moscowensis]|nr:DUF91 domain-containing protein [Candidatus Thiothrix moscowensis]